MTQKLFIGKSILTGPDPDKVTIAGLTLPGAVTVEHEGLESKYDEQPAPGTEGAWITYQGYPPARFKIRMSSPFIEHKKTMEAWIDKYAPKEGKKKPDPVDVYADALGKRIKKCIIRKVIPNTKNQVFECVIECTQYFKPPKINRAKTIGAQNNVFVKEDLAKTLGVDPAAIAPAFPAASSRRP